MPPYVTVEKAADSNPTAKQPTIASAGSSSSTTAVPVSSGVPLSGIAIGGIVAGCIIGVLIFVLGSWCTYRRLSHRGNNDPPGLGVPTTNFFDPTAPGASRAPGSSSNRYMQEDYFPKQPTVPGLNYASPEGVAEMAGNPVSYSQGTNWWGAAGQVPPNGAEGQGRTAVYEVRG